MARAIRVQNVAGTNRFLVAVPSVHITLRGFVTRGWRFKHHYIVLENTGRLKRKLKLFKIYNLGDAYMASFFSLQDAVSYLAGNANLD